MVFWGEFFEYKWKYFVSYLLKGFYKNIKNASAEVCFVTRDDTKGWILDAKCQRLSGNMDVKTTIHYSSNFKKLPKARAYFFSHYKFFAKALRYNFFLWNVKSVVLFTHPSWNKAYSERHIGDILRTASKIICLNSAITEELKNIGIPSEKLVVFHIASDPEVFTHHERGNGKIGFCMNYYERKNPDLMFDLVKNMQEYEFILIGGNWDKYKKFDELIKLNNFKYYNGVDYDQYPSLYRQMDVFVSTSFLEGGPVPLLEAMLSNVVPVVSNTGFCPDIVEHGKNGFPFDTSANYKEVRNLIIKALSFKENVRPYVTDYSWKRYAEKIQNIYYPDTD